MDPGANWRELNDQSYKFHYFNTVIAEQKSLDFQGARIAVARWGGPVAATKNQEKIVLTKAGDIIKDSISFFNNSGKLFSKVPYKDLDKIVLFEFLEEDLLLVLKASGTYLLVDPMKQSKKVYELDPRFESDNLVGAQVCGDSVMVLSTSLQFYYFPNIHHTEMVTFSSTLAEVPAHWVLVPGSATSKVEVLAAHKEAGVVRVSEDDQDVLYNAEKHPESRLPNLPGVQMVAVSESLKLFSFLCFEDEQWSLTVLSDEMDHAEEPAVFFQINLDLREDHHDGPQDQVTRERPQKMLWCADDCVVLQLVSHVILVGGDCSTRIKMPSKNFATRQELDGVRFVSQKKNEILRRLPKAFTSVFKPLSTEPGAMLYSTYESFQSKLPIEDDGLRNEKKQLSEAVYDCILAGQFETVQDQQLKLLQAASYGKQFLIGFEPDLLSQTCKVLRASNCIRRGGSVGGRVLTYHQLLRIQKQKDLLVRLLLRYQLHYLAYEITKYLNLPLKYRAAIYTHWACQKVESTLDDESLCLVLKEKIKEEKGVSFTEIAHKAIEVNRASLALRLLQNEPLLSKRVPVLLWMGTYLNNLDYFEKGLEDATYSRDSNLVYLVIMKYLKDSKLDETLLFDLMSRNQLVMSHLITYLQNFDEDMLKRYLKHLRKIGDCAFLCVQKGYRQKQLLARIQCFSESLQYLQEEEEDRERFRFYIKVLTEQIEQLKELSMDKSRKKKNVGKEVPINDILLSFLKKQNRDEEKIAKEFARVQKIPERRYLLSKVKAMIENKKFDEIEGFVNQANKVSYQIPCELVGQLLMEANQEEKALGVIAKMPDVDECVTLLCKIWKLKEAAQVGMSAQRLDLVYEVRSQVQEVALQNFIDNYLSQHDK